MKPCIRNRELIAGLALGALNAGQERDLRAHLVTCERCRHYQMEISAVTDKLAAVAVRSDIQTSESFHRRVVGALRSAPTESAWETLVAPLRAIGLNWRMVLPVVGATAVVIAALSVFKGHPGVPLPPAVGALAVPAPGVERDPDPTLSNYQMMANRSLEELDALLTRQGNRNLPCPPIYTASALARASALD